MRAARALLGAAAGLGLDVVEISRVRSVASRNPRFLRRVFSPREIAYCSTKRRKWQHFAVRFAAKEAVWKALSGGEAPPPSGRVSLKDIEVRRGPDGRPGVAVRGREMPQILLSLTHGERQAVAVALVLAGKLTLTKVSGTAVDFLAKGRRPRAAAGRGG